MVHREFGSDEEGAKWQDPQNQTEMIVFHFILTKWQRL